MLLWIFYSLIDEKNEHKETLRKVRVHQESRIAPAILISFQCFNSHPAFILLCDTESKLT